MWATYEFRGHRVTVIQQWRDPFGRKLVRIELVAPGEDQADGMLEDEFMREAVELPE